MVKKLVFDGTSIEEGHCNTFKVNIQLKDFLHTTVCDPFAFYSDEKIDNGDGTSTKELGTSLSADKILYWYNQAELVEYREGWLKIHTERYVINVEVNKK